VESYISYLFLNPIELFFWVLMDKTQNIFLFISPNPAVDTYMIHPQNLSDAFKSVAG